MSSIIKIYLGIWLMLNMVLLSFGIMSSFMKVLNEQSAFEQVIDHISETNGSREALEEDMQRTTEQGGKVKYTFMYSEGNEKSCTKKIEIPNKLEDVNKIKIQITYPDNVGGVKGRKYTGYVYVKKKESQKDNKKEKEK